MRHVPGEDGTYLGGPKLGCVGMGLFGTSFGVRVDHFSKGASHQSSAILAQASLHIMSQWRSQPWWSASHSSDGRTSGLSLPLWFRESGGSPWSHIESGSEWSDGDSESVVTAGSKQENGRKRIVLH